MPIRTDPSIMRAGLNELYRSSALLSVAVLLAFAPDSYLPMLARAFVVPATILLLLVAIMSMVRRRWWLAQASLLGAALTFVQVPLPMDLSPSRPSAWHFRVFHMNVLRSNTAYHEAIVQAMDSDADVVSVQEVSFEWAQALCNGLGEHYPYVHIEPRTDCYGIALFSKHPFRRVRTVTLKDAPFIDALLDVGAGSVRLIAVHASSPTSHWNFQRRNEQLMFLGRYVVQAGPPTILVGDLNTVPWDQAFRKLCQRSGLRALSPVLHRTWPTFGAFTVIPLDHVLVSKGICPVAVRIAPVRGSDHHALIADLRSEHHAH